jgi:hypothetical protein
LAMGSVIPLCRPPVLPMPGASPTAARLRIITTMNAT